jgi:hypothetical protein
VIAVDRRVPAVRPATARALLDGGYDPIESKARAADRAQGQDGQGQDLPAMRRDVDRGASGRLERRASSAGAEYGDGGKPLNAEAVEKPRPRHRGTQNLRASRAPMVSSRARANSSSAAISRGVSGSASLRRLRLRWWSGSSPFAGSNGCERPLGAFEELVRCHEPDPIVVRFQQLDHGASRLRRGFPANPLALCEFLGPAAWVS